MQQRLPGHTPHYRGRDPRPEDLPAGAAPLRGVAARGIRLLDGKQCS
jgi:hypothetical protein